MINYNFISLAGNLVPAVRTPVSDPEMIDAIKICWRELHQVNKNKFPNPEPTPDQIALIMAKNAGETGRDRSKMFNYNIGNITIGQGSGNYWEGKDWRYVRDPKDSSKRIKEQITNKFRHYADLKSGVKDYLLMMSSSDKYKQAWDELIAADPSKFSKELRKQNYYSEDEAIYTKRLISLFNSFKQKIKNPETIKTLKEVIIRAAPPKSQHARKKHQMNRKKNEIGILELERLNQQLTSSDLADQENSLNIQRIDQLANSMLRESSHTATNLIKLCNFYYLLAKNNY